MAGSNGIYFTLASVCLLVFCNSALAQTDSSSTSTTVAATTSTAVPTFSCENATPFQANGTLLLGTWYEAARKPVGGGNNTEQCVQLIVSFADNKITTQITYSIDPTALYINKTTTNTIQVNSGATPTPQVFPAMFYVLSGGVNTTMKILDTDYDSYMYVCGYPTVTSSVSTTTESTSVSSSSSSSSTSTVSSSSTAATSTTTEAASTSTAGAFIMTRVRSIESGVLASLTSAALVHYPDFKGISTVTQSEKCYTSSAATNVPLVAMIMAIVYSVLKLVH